MIAIHHFLTDFTNEAPRKAWAIFNGDAPATPTLYDFQQAVAAARAMVTSVPPGALREKLANKAWRDDHEVWTITLKDGTQDWAETQVEVA
jgi:hypothetical protein